MALLTPAQSLALGRSTGCLTKKGRRMRVLCGIGLILLVAITWWAGVRFLSRTEETVDADTDLQDSPRPGNPNKEPGQTHAEPYPVAPKAEREAKQENTEEPRAADGDRDYVMDLIQNAAPSFLSDRPDLWSAEAVAKELGMRASIVEGSVHEDEHGRISGEVTISGSAVRGHFQLEGDLHTVTFRLASDRDGGLSSYDLRISFRGEDYDLSAGSITVQFQPDLDEQAELPDGQEMRVGSIVDVTEKGTGIVPLLMRREGSRILIGKLDGANPARDDTGVLNYDSYRIWARVLSTVETSTQE